MQKIYIIITELGNILCKGHSFYKISQFKYFEICNNINLFYQYKYTAQYLLKISAKISKNQKKNVTLHMNRKFFFELTMNALNIVTIYFNVQQRKRFSFLFPS